VRNVKLASAATTKTEDRLIDAFDPETISSLSYISGAKTREGPLSASPHGVVLVAASTCFGRYLTIDKVGPATKPSARGRRNEARVTRVIVRVRIDDRVEIARQTGQ
jgi:hypothetical protein